MAKFEKLIFINLKYLKMSNRITLLFITFLVFSFSLSAQKARYFKFSTPGCPIDPLKEVSPKGLIRGNIATILVKDVVIQRIEIKKQKDIGDRIVEIRDTIRTNISDTILLESVMLERGLAFDVLQQIGSYSVIRLWPPNLNEQISSSAISGLEYIAGKNNKSITNALKISGVVGKIGTTTTVDFSSNDYIIPTRLLTNNSVEFENKVYQWNIGVLAMPIKIRPFATQSGQFDFLDGVSFGTTFSWTVGHNWQTGRTASFFLYAGLSSFTADSTKIKEDREDYKITTFSPGVGLIFEKSKIQFSIMTGMDFPAGQLQKKWVYRNMPWLSIGLGFSIFKISNDESGKTGVNPGGG